MLGPASAKQKRAVVRALGGAWPALACEFASSHLVEKCFDFAVRRLLHNVFLCTATAVNTRALGCSARLH
jgi:hypothetical protein